MLNYKKILLSTTLAMAILAPSAVYAGTLNDVTPKCDMKVCQKSTVASNCKMVCCQNKKDLKCNKKEKLQQNKGNLAAKIQMYNKVLQNAEKFVPGTVKIGDASANKTKELVKQIISIRKEKTDASILPLKKEFKAQVTAIELQVTKGEITKQEAKVQLLAKQKEKIIQVRNIKNQFKNENKIEKDAINVKTKAVIESFKTFEASIKSKNAKTIENSFNIYIQNINELNIMLQQVVNQLTA